MLKGSFLFILLICGVCYAQKKSSPVFVVGRVISAEDSLRMKGYFYEGLREKAKLNCIEAEKYFKQVLEISPANDAALYELANYNHLQNQDKEAERLIRMAVTVDPENKWYWLLLADIYKKNRNIEQLTLAFNELIRIDPYEEDYYYDKANALYIQNKNDEAQKVYTEIEQRFGNSENLVTARQRVYQKQGKSEKASSDLEGLISSNPTEMRNYLNLSEVYLKAGNIKKTIEILDKAKSVNASDPYIRLALADAYKSQGKNAQAFDELKVAFNDPGLNIDAKIQIILSLLPEFKNSAIRTETVALGLLVTQTHPTDPKSFSVYGDVLFQDNQLDKAKTSYKQALKLNDQVYQIWEQLLNIEVTQRDYASAITDGEEALTLFPNQAPLYLYTAIALAQTGKHEKAISYLKNASTLEVEDKQLLSQIYSGLGDSYNGVKKFKDSDQAYEKALELNPNNSYVLNNYAYYLSLRNENLDRAASMSKKSNELEQGNASFEDTYAWVLFKQKKYTEARIWIEKAIKHNPENGTQQEHYGDILFKIGEPAKALEHWKIAKAKGEKSSILEKKIYEKKYIE
jgi:tetratricopeptide (TPR) repeat protein